MAAIAGLIPAISMHRAMPFAIEMAGTSPVTAIPCAENAGYNGAMDRGLKTSRL